MSVSLDARLREIARRVKWFDAPEHTLAHETDFLCRVMTFATFEDAAIVEHEYGRARMIAALTSAAPGVIDARSWTYWHLRLGRTTIEAVALLSRALA